MFLNLIRPAMLEWNRAAASTPPLGGCRSLKFETLVTTIIPRQRTTVRGWLLVLLPPLCFLLKDIIALVALLPVDVNSERADLYYFVAFLPGTVYVHGTRAIILNFILGVAVGFALPRFLSHLQRNLGFSIVRGIAGGVLGGTLWLLIITIAAGGFAAWQWWVVGMVLSFIPFAIVGAVVALGVLAIESWIAKPVGVVPRALFGTAIATAIRIYSPLAACRPYYEPCTVTGVVRDLLFYGITIGAAAGILAGFRTEKSVV